MGDETFLKDLFQGLFWSLHSSLACVRFGSVRVNGNALDVHELGDVTGDARAAPSLPHGALDGDVVQLGDVSNLQGRRSSP